MSVIDLDEYPNGTEEILMALWRNEQRREDDDLQTKSMKRRRLASQTSLNKQQVRYRLQQLVEDNYVTEDTWTEHNQRVTYYALPPDGKESARAIGEAKEVLGEIPEQIGRQDLLKLTSEMAALRAEMEAAGFDLEDTKKSEFKQELSEFKQNIDELKQDLDEWIQGSKYQWNEINRTEDDLMDLWDAVLLIQEELDIRPVSDELDVEPMPEEKDYSHLNDS